MKKPLRFAAILCGCLFLSAAAQAEQGAPGQGFRFGPRKAWTLSPRVNVGAFWETNARNTSSSEKSGGGWRVTPSLSLTYGDANARTSLSSSAFYTMERGFESKNAQDSDSYGASLTLRRELRKNLTLTASGSYSRTENDEFYGQGWNTALPELSRIDTDKTEHYNANVALGYQGERWRWSVGAGWSRTKQLSGYKYESDSYNVSLLAGRAVATRHYWNLSLSTTWDDAAKASYAYYLMTGLSGQLERKLSYNFLLGAAVYDYSGYQDHTAVGPSYTASLAYKINRTFAASLALSSQYKPEYAGNQSEYYVWSHNLTLGVNAQWSDRLSSRLNTAVVYEEHSSEIVSDYDRTYLKVGLNSSYKLNAYASVYAGVSWKTDQYSGSRGGDTDDLRGDVGLTFTF